MFEYSVDSLCHCILVWTIAFCHAASDLIFFQYGLVGVTTILQSPVWMMNELLFWMFTVSYRLFQGRNCPTGIQTLWYIEPHYFLGIGIGHQRQVHWVWPSTNVGNVRNPYLLWSYQRKRLKQVLMFSKPMVCVSADVILHFRDNMEMVGPNDAKQTICSQHHIL